MITQFYFLSLDTELIVSNGIFIHRVIEKDGLSSGNVVRTKLSPFFKSLCFLMGLETKYG